MNDIDWNKAITDIVDALNAIGGALNRIEDQLYDLNEYGIVVRVEEAHGK